MFVNNRVLLQTRSRLRIIGKGNKISSFIYFIEEEFSLKIVFLQTDDVWNIYFQD